MTFEELGLSMDSQVDGVHATDLGMFQYAEAYSEDCKDPVPVRSFSHDEAEECGKQ